MSDVQALQVVVFEVGELACAVPARSTREVLPELPATRLPGADRSVVGLVNVRGTLVTVVDAHVVLGQARHPGHDGALLVVERGLRGSGLLVGQVLDFVEMPPDAGFPDAAVPGLDPRLVRGIGLREGRHFVLLDPEALLAPVLGPGGPVS